MNAITEACPVIPPGPAPAPGMVWVPAGTYRMGSDNHYPEEAPSHPVSVDGFWMDASPVTNAQFPVLTRAGAWIKPMLLGVIDDRSRLICHLQWYLDETACSLVHGLSQAFMKRGLPRALMTDNGAAMLAEETVAGHVTIRTPSRSRSGRAWKRA